MKWLLAAASLCCAVNAHAQWVEPQHAWLQQGDFDRPHPAHHRAEMRPLSVPSPAIPNWPFPNIDVTNSPSYGQFEPSTAINPIDSNNIVIGLIDDSSFSTLAYSATTDGGITWSRKLLPQRTDVMFGRATDPSVAFDAQGSAFFALGFYDGASVNNAVSLFQSTDLESDWMPRADAFENVDGDTISDKFYVAVDRSASSRFAGRIYISWVDQGEPGYVRIVCAYSSDKGQSWSERRYLSNLGHYTAPVPIAEPDGTLLVAFVDYYHNNFIYVARSNDGGVTFLPSQAVAQYSNIGPLFPNDSLGYENIGPPGSALGVNSFPSIAIDASPLTNERTYLTWCGRGSDNLPHIWLKTSDNDGVTWSDSRQVDGDSIPNPSAKFFPWVAVDPSTGHVGVAYYSATMGTDLSADLYLAYSTDGGASFTTRRISNASFNPITYQDYRTIEGNTIWFFGDYIGLAGKDDRWFPAWCDSRSGDAEIYTAIVQPFAPMPVTNLATHDTTVDGKHASVLTWQYTPETTFGYPLPGGYQFEVAKDGSRISLQPGDTLQFVDTNIQQGREYEVTVLSGSYRSITDSITNAKSAVAPQPLSVSFIRFSNEPAIAGRADELLLDCGEECHVTITFYDELGRELVPEVSDGIISSHHELVFTPEVPGVQFFVIKEISSTSSKEITGKISVLR